MANYMVRVELSRADGEEYKTLHEGMEAVGSKRTVVFDDGVRHKMPDGTYFGSSNLSPEALRNRVKSIADPLASMGVAAIFVCQSQDWSAWLFEG